MKKNCLYVYLDSPIGIETGIKKFSLHKFYSKKFKLKIINASLLNYSKSEIKNFIKHTDKNDIPRNLLNIENLSEFNNFLKRVKKKDLLLIRTRSAAMNRFTNFDTDLFNHYKIKTISIDYLHTWINCNFKKNFLLNLIRLLWMFKQKITYSIKNSNFEPNYLIGSGKISKLNYKKLNSKKTKYIDCPSYYLNFEKNSNKGVKKNIIYIDENVYFSRDQYLVNKGYKKIMNLEVFLKDLNELFDQIEKKYKTKVTIACSNKYKYKKNLFDNRKIIYGKTLRLISNSKFVMGHKSSALVQVLSAQVPAVLLKHKTFDFMRNLKIELFSNNYFNSYAYYIEDLIKGKVELNNKNVDKKFYEKILNNYFLTSNIKNENFGEKFRKEINKIN